MTILLLQVKRRKVVDEVDSEEVDSSILEPTQAKDKRKYWDLLNPIINKPYHSVLKYVESWK